MENLQISKFSHYKLPSGSELHVRGGIGCVEMYGIITSRTDSRNPLHQEWREIYNGNSYQCETGTGDTIELTFNWPSD